VLLLLLQQADRFPHDRPAKSMTEDVFECIQ
jgi:hypothetical protein